MKRNTYDKLMKTCAGICIIGMVFMIAGICRSKDYATIFGLGMNMGALIIMATLNPIDE